MNECARTINKIAVYAIVSAILLFPSLSYSSDKPCDIYQAGGTPCVAAHSTTRALYSSYNGFLYQVRRSSDNATLDIGLLSQGGVANAAAQDQFCANATCYISKIYDQSPKGNHLVASPVGGWLKTPAAEAVATDAKIMLDGHVVYGISVFGNGFSTTKAGVGYRNNKTNGVPKGDNPEGIYMVTGGKHYNPWCCYDYGNAGTTNEYEGPGTMEALYFGNSTQWGKGTGDGPWVMADLEAGLFAGSSFDPPASNVTLNFDYVTAILKGDSGNHFALKGGNSQSGSLIDLFDGPRPSGGYSPMNKKGAILLGIGGDNSNTGEGTFFEGAMTEGYPSVSSDNAVQANIVSAGYGSATPIITVSAYRDTVLNGSFDQGTMGWTFNTWGGTAQGSVVNGEYKIDISALGTANSSIQLVQNGIILQQGKTYEVKFDAYASANRTLEANVELDVSPWTSYLPELKTFNLTTSKSTYSYFFTMPNATDSNGRISFNAGASTTGLFLDNVSIKVIPTPVSLQELTAQSRLVKVIQNGNHLEVALNAAQGGSISIGLYDISGKPVRTSARMEGKNSLSWTTDLTGIPTGIYFVKVAQEGREIHSSKIKVGR